MDIPCGSAFAGLLFVGSGGLALFIVSAAGPKKQRPVVIADKSTWRRPNDGAAGHALGALLFAVMVAAAIAHPICG